MADVHFRITYALMSPHISFGVPEGKGKGVHWGKYMYSSVTRSGLLKKILGNLNAILNCRVPMADVHFQVPYGPMSPHR